MNVEINPNEVIDSVMKGGSGTFPSTEALNLLKVAPGDDLTMDDLKEDGIKDSHREALKEGGYTIQALANLESTAELIRLPGIGIVTAQRIVEAAKALVYPPDSSKVDPNASQVTFQASPHVDSRETLDDPVAYPPMSTRVARAIGLDPEA